MTAHIEVAHEEEIIGPFAVRKHRLPAGAEIDTDVHPFDHLSILLWGSVMLDCDGKCEVLIGPRTVLIKAGIAHRITCITDTGWDCVRIFEQAKLEAA